MEDKRADASGARRSCQAAQVAVILVATAGQELGHTHHAILLLSCITAAIWPCRHGEPQAIFCFFRDVVMFSSSEWEGKKWESQSMVRIQPRLTYCSAIKPYTDASERKKTFSQNSVVTAKSLGLNTILLKALVTCRLTKSIF